MSFDPGPDKIPAMNTDKHLVGRIANHPSFHAGQYLMFRVGREHFAVDVSRVRGILPWHELIAPAEDREPGSPGSDKHVTGYAFVRGVETPVIDLRRKLRLGRAPAGRSPYIVVVDTGAPVGPRLAGFVADGVSDVVEASLRDYRQGKLRTGGRPRRVLDPDEVFGRAFDSEEPASSVC
jgi:chemotaxis signal transduction protein